MKILVIGPTWVGDTVLATPVFANLRAAFPAAKIYCLATAWAAGILEGHPAIDELRIRPGGTVGDLRAAFGVRANRVDWAIVLPNSFRGALIAAATGARRRTGYSRDWRKSLLTEPVPFVKDPERHQVDEYLALLEAAGLHIQDRIPRISPSQEAKDFTEGIFETAGIRPEDLAIGLQPGAKFGATKLWPPERYAAVGDRLAESEGARIVLLGGPEEAPLTASISSAMKTQALDLAGKDRLSLLPALLQRLDLLLTGDTGPMHVAAAVGTPVVALFGPTDPKHTAPVGDHNTVLRRNLFCSPCFLKTCPYGHECMEQLEVDEVYQAAREGIRAVAESHKESEPCNARGVR
jgi:heptosyltransferase-2